MVTDVISSNTLFHFTDSSDNLISILENEFYPRYSLENWSFLNKVERYEKWEIAIPMVCFCDLPLSKIRSHLEFYGNYGIGLKKEWGLLNGINPVLYINVGSYLHQYLIHICEKNTEITNKSDVSLITNELLSFVKLYEDKIWRNNEYLSKKFYDEREWRFVPYLLNEGYNIKDTDYRLSEEEYFNPVKLSQANLKIEQRIKLKFEPNDIKYLIVKEENEILPLINAVNKIKQKYSEDVKKVLFSRIISCEHILTDF